MHGKNLRLIFHYYGFRRFWNDCIRGAAAGAYIRTYEKHQTMAELSLITAGETEDNEINKDYLKNRCSSLPYSFF